MMIWKKEKEKSVPNLSDLKNSNFHKLGLVNKQIPQPFKSKLYDIQIGEKAGITGRWGRVANWNFGQLTKQLNLPHKSSCLQPLAGTLSFGQLHR